MLQWFVSLLLLFALIGCHMAYSVFVKAKHIPVRKTMAFGVPLQLRPVFE